MKKRLLFMIILAILFLVACSSTSAEKDPKNQTATVVEGEEKSLEEIEKEEAKAIDKAKAIEEAKAMEKAQAEKEVQEEQAFREEVISNIILEETSCEQQRNYIYSKGYVKNTSMYGLFGIQIRTEYLDSTGGIVDTDSTYAVAPYEFILPDERKYFEIMTPANANIVNCNTYVLEFDM